MTRIIIVSLIAFGILSIGYAIVLLVSKFTNKAPKPVPAPPAEPEDFIVARRAELEARRKAVVDSRELADISRELQALDAEASLIHPAPTPKP